MQSIREVCLLFAVWFLTFVEEAYPFKYLFTYFTKSYSKQRSVPNSMFLFRLCKSDIPTFCYPVVAGIHWQTIAIPKMNQKSFSVIHFAILAFITSLHHFWFIKPIHTIVSLQFKQTNHLKSWEVQVQTINTTDTRGSITFRQENHPTFPFKSHVLSYF